MQTRTPTMSSDMYLRRKLGKDLVTSVRGMGYRLERMPAATRTRSRSKHAQPAGRAATRGATSCHVSISPFPFTGTRPRGSVS